jgi:hypothetical protein
MSEEEKRATEQKKREGSREGRQHVPNTEGAKKAREDAEALPIENYDGLSVKEIKKELDGVSDEDLERVREYEKANRKRKTLLEALEREF